MNENEINDNTRIIYMPGRNYIRLTKLPPNLEYAFCL
jgi:hypothetical protein